MELEGTGPIDRCICGSTVQTSMHDARAQAGMLPRRLRHDRLVQRARPLFRCVHEMEEDDGTDFDRAISIQLGAFFDEDDADVAAPLGRFGYVTSGLVGSYLGSAWWRKVHAAPLLHPPRCQK